MGYDSVISTVHPRNIASLMTSFKIDQEVVRLGNYYNYCMCFIMFSSLHQNLRLSSLASNTVITPMDKYNKIYQLLEKNIKYIA